MSELAERIGVIHAVDLRSQAAAMSELAERIGVIHAVDLRSQAAA